MASYPSPREPLLDRRLHMLLTQRGKEMLGLALICLGLGLALILGSYAPEDPGWMAATDEPVSNALGRLGAAIAAPMVIIAGQAGWGLVLALVVWGLRLFIHRGEGAILARGVFLPVAVALGTVWAASLVPGPGWAQDFGLGGMFGDTVLGALLSALPISSTPGFNILTAILFLAMVTLWLYVLGATFAELRLGGQVLLAGLVLVYAGFAALTAWVLLGLGRGAARLLGGALALGSRQAATGPSAPAEPRLGPHGAAYGPDWHAPAPDYHDAPDLHDIPATAPRPRAQPPLTGPVRMPPPLRGGPEPSPTLSSSPHAWAQEEALPEPPAQRIARVVRAAPPQAAPPQATPQNAWPQDALPQAHMRVAAPMQAPSPADFAPRFRASSAPSNLVDPPQIEPRAAAPAYGGPGMMGAYGPALSATGTPAPHTHEAANPAPATIPAPGWDQPAGRGLLSRVAGLARRETAPQPAPMASVHADPTAASTLVPELIEPRLSADLPPPPPERIRSRISDLLRGRKTAKPVLRFDPEARPPLNAQAGTQPANALDPAGHHQPEPFAGLRPEPPLSGAAAMPAQAVPHPAPHPAPLSAPHPTSHRNAEPPAPAAPLPSAPSAGGLFGLIPGLGWTASVQDARLSAPPPSPAVPMAPQDEEDDPYGPPPEPRAGVYNRRVVQQPVRKPAAPSARARAEAEPRLPLEPAPPAYELPPLALLSDPRTVERYSLSDEALEENARMLESVLDDYGVRGEIVAVRPGPVVTLYELEPAPGLKASRVIGLADDIARSMSALSARVSTVPGRSVIGIELPNARREKVLLREILASRDFDNDSLRLPLALGKDIGGESVVANLAKMPHLLIAGTTGSGKSVAINTMILSLLYKLTPEECRLIMIDPKMLELSVYDGIPHLLSPVVTDPKKAVTALKWVVAEMEERYRRMSKMGVRNIEGYNGRVREALARGDLFKRTVQTGFDDETGDPVFETEEFAPELLPFIVVVVDEMADLMMVAGKEIEACIQRLAQMARASGIHLIMATQRPSVDVITGTIKANFPTRISFQVTSKIDSRTILGEMGAEQLLGMGDMLYMAGGSKITRIHGPFVSDEEVEEVVTHLKSFGPPSYETGVLEGPDGERESEIDAVLGLGDGTPSEDALYDQAVAIVARDRKCSTSYIQRKLGIGYNKAARLVEQMEDQGIVTRANQVGKREILVPEA